ncbi:MAG: hypothetical protein DCC71_15345 [Proteobacteria bacterium]|nr:MAG: hypothetical protein DCC71_15345 [Pseudomonadota bacterium]
MHPAFQRTSHRPWSLPHGPWVARQSWRDLLFAHWPVPAERLRPLVPPALTVQEFDGTSWVGVTPFRIEDAAPRGIPALPGLSRFLELNVRLYVERGGRAGIWFLSLDASSAFAVWTARSLLRLPYFRARMNVLRDGGGVAYRSQRVGEAEGPRFAARYAPCSPIREAEPGSLEHWLTERYCLWSQWLGRLYRLEIHHRPWPLQRAEAEFERNEMLAPHAIDVGDGAPLLHFAPRLDVVAWAPVPER